MSPRVSIVVPTHGAAGLLEATLASIRAQTLVAWELIVVDDGSRDGTAAVAQALAEGDARVRVVRQENAGIARARNHGLAETDARSEFVIWLDHDDLWEPRALEWLAAALDARPGLVAAHGAARYIDALGQPLRPGELECYSRTRLGIDEGRLVAWPANRPTSFANLVYSDCVVSVGSLLARRRALPRDGPFDERAAPADDYDLWLRLARLGDFAFVDEVVLAYRLHARMTSGEHSASLRARRAAYVRRKLALAAENTPAQRRQARLGYRACQRAVRGRALTDARRLLGAGRLGAAAACLLVATRAALCGAWGCPLPWRG